MNQLQHLYIKQKTCVGTGIFYDRPPLTGIYTIYQNFDNGWHLSAGTYNYTPPEYPLNYAMLDTSITGVSSANQYDGPGMNNTLKYDNFYGNKYRFTDEFGGQTYTSGYMIDHLTGLGWDMNLVNNENYETILLASTAHTFGGFNDWRLPNINEVDSINSNRNWYAHCGVDLGQASLWTSTTRFNATTSIIYLSVYSSQSLLKTTVSTSYNRIFCRNHYT